METLESALLQFAPDQPLLAGVTKASTVRALLNDASALRELVRVRRTSCVALCGLHPAELLPALVALDGVVRQILLLSATLDTNDRERLILESGVTDIVTPGLLHSRLSEPPSISDMDVSTRWALTTSGTTGTPKLIIHNFSTLTRTVRRASPNESRYVWGLLYDGNRFAGLQVILQAVLSGSLLAVPENSEFDSQISTIVNCAVSAISATPTMWRKLLWDGRITCLKLRQITLGGEIADQSILNALKTNFPSSRISHIYASTEAGTGFSVQDGKAGFPSSWLASHTPALRIDERQHLLIKPPVMPEGQEISSRLTDDGYLDTHDLVEIQGDRILFRGRVNGAINVGGNKINPEWLETYLRSIAGVVEARVFGRPNSMTGQLIAAEIVKDPNVEPALLRQHILQQCHRDLVRWQIPVFITFIDAFPATNNGKITRNDF